MVLLFQKSFVYNERAVAMQFINTSKELFYGDRYFKEHVMAEDFEYRAHKRELSPFFAERGFKVSMMYNDYYSRLSGIVSDRYLSMDLYYMYILPSLNRRDMQKAYADKNAYSKLFDDVPQPVTIVRNRNGFFFDDQDNPLSIQDALMKSLNQADCIIKPTVETGDGVGVERFDSTTIERIKEQFVAYRCDFIVQKFLVQHPEMARLNPSSLNSMRLMTYRSNDGTIHFLSGKTFLRVGGKGSCKDNVSAGGGMMHVDDDGSVRDRVVRYKSMRLSSLKSEFGIDHFKVPNFDGAIEMVMQLHRRIWYCDLLGWDVAIREDGMPTFVEMNVVPACESIQQGSGPLFENILLDEVVNRVSCVKKSTAMFSINRFRPGFDYLLQIGGEEVHVN